MSASPASGSPAPPTEQAKRHGLSATEKHKLQLEKLSKDLSKPAFIPAAPQEKTIRPAREMMKNVQGSSAGAGSGEFHVYKAGRRREYERLKIFEEQTEKEKRDADFARQRQEAEAVADAKTAKNRAKRQKKKERTKAKSTDKPSGDGTSEAPFKKRRLIDGGKELVFRKPGEESDEEEDQEVGPPAPTEEPSALTSSSAQDASQASEIPRIIIHDD